jgi:hypothetical protein
MRSSKITFITGVAEGAAGLALTVFSYHRDPDLARIALTLLIIAAVSISTSLLARCVLQANQPANKAYQLGYEEGYDKGWAEANDATKTAPRFKAV